MNSELRYIGRALLMIVTFFACFKIVQYSLSVKITNPVKESTILYIDSDPSIITVGEDGKALFAANCASCHSVVRKLVGPALAGVSGRVGKKLLHEWIRNSSKVLKSGNKYFNNLYKEYGKVQMTSFPSLTDDEIDAILNYIDN